MVTENDIQEASMATLTFERDLEKLVLEAFAKGARLEGTWEIRPRPTTVPNWTIEIRRHSTPIAEDTDTTVFDD